MGRLNKKKLTASICKKENLLKIIGLILIFIIIMCSCIITGVLHTPFNDPLNSFQGPNYIPNGYNWTNTNNTANEKRFTFAHGQDQFMVVAIKDVNKTKMSELKNGLLDESAPGIKVNNENITIDGNNVVLQTISMDLMGMHINMFYTSWFCKQTGLTILVMGNTQPHELNEMKKMVTSIQCHPEKEAWNLFGLKISF